MANIERFTGRLEAARHVGLAYIFAEFIFFLLATLSPLVVRSRIIRRSRGIAVPKYHPIWKDAYKLALFCFVGILVPVVLSLKMVDSGGNLFFQLLGCYIVVLVFQHNINVVLFDNFRGNRLPEPKKSGGLWPVLDRWSSYLIPLDPRGPDMSSYAVTSGRRRIVIAVMDFWLMLVGFALIYSTLIPTGFHQPLHEFSKALYFSVIAGLTVGFGDNYPVTELSRALVVFQSGACFLFALIIIAHVVGLIPKVRTLEE